MAVKSLILLSYSLKNLDLTGIKYEFLDKEPRTISGLEKVAIYFNETPVIYNSYGYWNQGNYKICDTIWHPEKENLEQEYAKEWAILGKFDYNLEGKLRIDEYTKWKPDAPSWKDWLASKGFLG